MTVKRPGQKFRVLPGRYAVCRLPPEAPVPDWVTGPFCNMTRASDELAVICPAAQVPAGITAERDWRVFRLVGPFSFSAIGVLASIATPLARAGISLLSIATYDTDYFLVKVERFKEFAALQAALFTALPGRCPAQTGPGRVGIRGQR